MYSQIADISYKRLTRTVDLTGQINSEAMGPIMYSGVGGQLDFQIGAFLSKGGRAITVLPSTARRGSVSRICALSIGENYDVARLKEIMQL